MQIIFFSAIIPIFATKFISMFSTGQIYFAIFFVIAFVIAMIGVYKRDLKIHKTFYKGSSLWVLLGFLSFVAILFVLKFYLKNN